MTTLSEGLPPHVASQVRPDWRKNEADYWALRDQLFAQYERLRPAGWWRPERIPSKSWNIGAIFKRIFAGDERILGRDVLNQIDVLFRGPNREVVINPSMAIRRRRRVRSPWRN
jgi:hypothetical protein